MIPESLDQELCNFSMTYWIAEKPTPLFNSPDLDYLFGMEDGKSLPLDKLGLFRPLEMIAFPGMVFETIEKVQGNDTILKVKTPSYPDPVYVDKRLLKAIPSMLKYSPELPSITTLKNALVDRIGLPYVWGGNISDGLEDFYSLYPPKGKISPELESIWKFKGLDCSGLLFDITSGKTPRNTSELLHFGKPIMNPSHDIFHCTFSQTPFFSSPVRCIEQLLMPLDLLVWKGHVVIVLDKRHIIESNHSLGGVIVLDLKQRLEQIMQERKIPTHDGGHRFDFTIRRWIR